jgi:predicted RNase H-like nuclease (RuvC/YqgF family)
MTNTGDQTNAGGDQSYRVSITPSWEAIAKLSIEALVNGTEEGQRMAREEIIDLGIKLDDAKEIIEEQEGVNKDTDLVPLRVLRGAINDKNKIILDQGDEIKTLESKVEALIEEKDKIIGQLESKVKARDKELNANDDHVEELEQKIEEKDKTIAELKERVDKLGLTIDGLIEERDEWRRLDSKLEAKDHIIATKNGELATLRDQIRNFGEDPEYDAELANGDGQDTSIDEQVANNQPYREGDE